VVEPKRNGFGLTMIRRGLPIELGGEVTIDFRPEGLQCGMAIPLPE
jgi:two-component system CheB/CheR fusion protein